MDESSQPRTCGVCRRTLGHEDEWIELDGGEVWCAECWQGRYSPQSLGSAPVGGRGQAQEVAAEPPAPADEGTAQRVCAVCGGAYPAEAEACTFCGATPGMRAPGAATEAAGGITPPVADTTPPAPAVSQSHIDHAQGATSQTRTSSLAVASLILSLVGAFGLGPMMALLRIVAPSVVTFALTVIIMVLGPVLGVVAVILGAVAMSAISKDRNLKGKGHAVAGLVTGIGGAVQWIIWISYFAYLVDSIKWPWN